MVRLLCHVDPRTPRSAAHLAAAAPRAPHTPRSHSSIAHTASATYTSQPATSTTVAHRERRQTPHAPVSSVPHASVCRESYGLRLYMGSLRTRRAPPRTVSGLLRGGHWPLAPHPAHPRAPSPRRGQRGVYSAPHPTSTTTEVRARVQRGSVHCGQRRGGQSDLALGPRTGHLTLLKSA